VGTIVSELGSLRERTADGPLVYADANLPWGLVSFMRARLGWDVFFVMEHADLRRAPDAEHFRRAREMRRTLITMDRDYFDDARFPLEECAGVIVLSAPDERALLVLALQLDEHVMREARDDSNQSRPRSLPLSGRKLHAHPGWRDVGGVPA
jgi:hypothetical protein